MQEAARQIAVLQDAADLGQCVVITVAPASHRRLYAGLVQTLCVANADVLAAPIGMVRQGMGCGLAFVQGLLQCIQHEVRLHTAADPPTHDATSVDVHHEGNALSVR